MKGSIGITRKMDNLGRVTIPKEYRRFFKMERNHNVEIIATDDGILIRVPNREVKELTSGKGDYYV